MKKNKCCKKSNNIQHIRSVAYYRIDKKMADFLGKVFEKYHVVGVEWSGGLNLGFVVEEKE